MPYEMVAEKLKILPESQLGKVADFIDFIQAKTHDDVASEKSRRREVLRSLSGILPSTITDEEVKHIRMYK